MVKILELLPLLDCGMNLEVVRGENTTLKKHILFTSPIASSVEHRMVILALAFPSYDNHDRTTERIIEKYPLCVRDHVCRESPPI